MTIDQARKILGKTSNNLPDSTISDFIDTAEIFKNIYLELVQEKDVQKLWHNKLNNNDQTKNRNLH